MTARSIRFSSSAVALLAAAPASAAQVRIIGAIAGTVADSGRLRARRDRAAEGRSAPASTRETVTNESAARSRFPTSTSAPTK